MVAGAVGLLYHPIASIKRRGGLLDPLVKRIKWSGGLLDYRTKWFGDVWNTLYNGAVVYWTTLLVARGTQYQHVHLV